MVAHIARKDFLSNLLSAKFAVGFVLCLVLIPFSIFINTSEVRDRTRLYRADAEAAARAVKQVRVYSALRPQVVKPPEPLAVFSRGVTGQVGNRVRIRLGEKPMLAEGRAATRDNPFLAAFFSTDFAGVVAVIFSLLALIFSYDAFTREKEDGTLRLELSNSLSRSRYLAGKLLGVFLTLFPILVFCYLLGAVLILVSPEIGFSAVEWGRIALLFGASLVYTAVFVFIGLLVSARSRTSVTSLVVSLFLWVVLVFIIPNLAAYIAQSFVRVQPRDNLKMALAGLDKEMDGKIEAHNASAGLAGPTMNWYYSGGEDGTMECYGSSKPVMEQYRLQNAYAEPLRLDYAEKRWAAQESYLASLGRQRIAAGAPQLVERVAQRRERIPQLVRQRREEFVLAAVGLPQQPLGATLLREVDADADGADHVVVAVVQRLDVVAHRRPVRDRVLHRQLVCRNVTPVALDAVLRFLPFRRCHRDVGFGRDAEQCGQRVVGGDRAALRIVRDRHGNRRAVDQRLEASKSIAELVGVRFTRRSEELERDAHGEPDGLSVHDREFLTNVDRMLIRPLHRRDPAVT